VVLFFLYDALFPNAVALVACNGLSFALAHLVYGNWTALVLSTLDVCRHCSIIG
jgi:hypothetical protein